MKSYLECWTQVAAALLPQALAGQPELTETALAPPREGSFGFAAELAGDQQGRFSMLLGGSVREASLLGEGVDQKAAWGDLLRETVESAAAEFAAASGRCCRVAEFGELSAREASEVAARTELQRQSTRAFELRSGERTWNIRVADATRAVVADQPAPDPGRRAAGAEKPLRSGLDLLLDVELEAALRFGSRELPLGEILELGPGDVVQLDRHVSDPVDLIVADKIVARGEVVLVNGNFGLRVTEVASPRMRLESIRCLF